MAKGCVLHYLSVIAVLSLSLLNQGWGVPKHYLVETQNYDNNTVGTQKEDNYVVGTQDDDNYVVGTQDDDNYVVGTQDDDAYVVGIHDNLARTDQDAFNEFGRRKRKWGKKKTTRKTRKKTTRKNRKKTTRKNRKKTTRKPKTTTTRKPKTTKKDVPCEDNNNRCPEWSRRGECKESAGYMLQRCRKSCNTCTGDDGQTLTFEDLLQMGAVYPVPSPPDYSADFGPPTDDHWIGEL